MSVKTEFLECPSESLDFFNTPLIQSGIRGYVDEEYGPVSALVPVSKQTITFNVASSTTNYIDLSRCYFITTFKLVKTDGTTIGNTITDKVGVINDLGQTWLKQLELKIGDTIVTEQNGLYAYQSYFEDILSYDETKLDNTLRMQNWVSDTPGKEGEPFPKTSANLGLNARSAHFNNSVIVKLITKPHINICNQQKYLPNSPGTTQGLQLTWNLTPNSDAFCLMSNADTEKLLITDIRLIVRKVMINENISNAIERSLMKSDIIYPVIQPHMSTHIIPKGTYNWDKDQIFNQKIPNRIFFGLVLNTAFNGTNKYNPVRFQDFDVIEVSVTINEQKICSDLKLKYDINNYLPAYNQLMNTLNNQPCLISYDTFKTCAIYGFDLTPRGNCADDQYLLMREGNLKLQLKFGTALPKVTNIVILGEFDRVLKIDTHRNVLKNW